jgi:hypothetical protein
MARARPRETVEGFAKREKDEVLEAIKAKEEYRRNAQRLADEMPGHFLRFCDMLRDAVKRFNENCDTDKRMYWRESAAVASRDPNPNADFNLTFNRAQSEVNMGLNAMGSSGKPPTYVFDINGKIKDDIFMARVEGQARDVITFRITINFKKQECDLKTFADRLVLGVASQELWQVKDDE